MSNADYREGQDDVLVAIAEFIGNGGTLDKDNFEQFAKTFEIEEKPNPYLNYSMDTLTEIQRIYTTQADTHSTITVEGVDYTYGEVIQFVGEAIERRQKTDYCKHGVFKWTEYDIPCGACEFE